MKKATKMVLDIVNEIEKKYKLNSLEIEGYRYWTYYRFQIIESICNDIKGLSRREIIESKDKYPNGVFDKIKEYVSLRKAYKTDGIIPRKKTDILFLSNGRRVLEEDGYYESPILDKIKTEFPNSIMYERLFKGEKYRPVKTNNLYVNYQRLGFFQLLIGKVKIFFKGEKYGNQIRVQLEKPLNEIKEALELKDNVKIPWQRMVISILHYKYYRKNIRKIIERCNPQIIIEECYYGGGNYMIYNEIAREKGIVTIEMQHGIMSKDVIPYNYPVNETIYQLPMYFFCHSEYDKEQMNFPIGKDNIIPVGCPYKEEKSKYYLSKKKKDNTKKKILFISSPFTNNLLENIALELVHILDEERYEIVYKLHPVEYNKPKTIFFEEEFSKVTLINTHKPSLYELISDSELIVDAHGSAATIESFLLEKPVCLHYASCFANFKSLCDKNIVQSFDTVEELAEIIENHRYFNSTLGKELLFQSDSLNKIKNEIGNILSNMN